MGRARGEGDSHAVPDQRIRDYEAFCERHGDWAIATVETLARLDTPLRILLGAVSESEATCVTSSPDDRSGI